jgi:hypothetical protein
MLLQNISIYHLHSILEIVHVLHLDMNMISREFMNMFIESLIQFWIGLSGRHIVGVVLRICLSANALYAPGHVVDRGCDREEIITLFLTFLSVMFLIHR